MKRTGAGFPATKGVPLDGERIEAIYSMPVFGIKGFGDAL